MMDDKDVMSAKKSAQAEGCVTAEEPEQERTDAHNNAPDAGATASEAAKAGTAETAAEAPEDANESSGTADGTDHAEGAEPDDETADAAICDMSDSGAFETLITASLLEAAHNALADCLLDDIASAVKIRNTAGYYSILDDIVQ